VGAEEEIGRALRVVLDTNVVVSALVFRGGRLAWLRQAWVGGQVVPIVSRDTLAELVRVLAYPKFGLTAEDSKNLLAHYMEHAEALGEVKTRVRLPRCRDEEDRAFLLLAHAARADALVTGDADLLVLAARSRIPILTPDALRQRLSSRTK
jgi:putative PIN family toxin of toxin-antitoxin system